MHTFMAQGVQSMRSQEAAQRRPVPRYRGAACPAILQHGFRPFFLAAAMWALISLAVWIAALSGWIPLASAFEPILWHAHEMLYGFILAAACGFLLTAVPNWTGRLPLQGLPLAGLLLTWLAGRIAVAFSSIIGAGTGAAIDLAFPAIMLVVIAREILAGQNWRNLPVASALAALLVADVLIHLEPLRLAETGLLGMRMAIGVMTTLVTLIGGRIVPSFTHNWLAKRGARKLPAPFGAVDRVSIGLTLGAVAAWVVAPSGWPTATLALTAAAASGARILRWQGHRTVGEPLVLILHIAYAWLPFGFVLIAFSAATVAVSQAAALHALTAGAMTTMILAVMTRATLGHTGRELHAGLLTVSIYVLASVAAVGFVAAALLPESPAPLLWLSGFAWIGAVGLFLYEYGPMLLHPRVVASAD